MMIRSLFLAASSMRGRSMHTVLSVLSVACGLTLLSVLFLLTQGIEEGIRRNAQGIDVIAGAKGSPLQLVLSSVYHADIPTGNIDMKDYHALRRNPQVRKAIPMAIGDNYKGWRVVGTTPDYLALYHAELADGRVFAEPFEVVAGAGTGLKTGQAFAAAHGFAADSDDVHRFHLYTVVGVLKPSGTVLDRLLVTPLEGVQQLHAHREEHEDHDESPEEEAAEMALAHQVTAVLIDVRSPVSVLNLPRQINRSSRIMAASPGYEMTRLSQNLGLGERLIAWLSGGMLALSMVMILSSLASGLAMRQYDLAILRVLGESRAMLFMTVIWEGALIGAAGAVCGLAAGHVLAWAIVERIDALQGFIAPVSLVKTGAGDAVLLATGIAAGALAALLPALSALRLDIAGLLAKGKA